MASVITLPYPPFTSAIIDKDTGMMTQPWMMWTQQLYFKLGGTTPFNASIPSVVLNKAYASNVIIVNNFVTPFYITPIGITQTIIDSLIIQNTSGAPNSVNVWNVPQGQTPTTSNIVANNQPVGSGATIKITALQGQIIGTGGYVVIQAGSPNVLLCTLSGRKIT